MKVTYPAIFTPEENGAYSVRFPDVPNAFTCGDDLTDAIEMAADVLGGILAADYIEAEKKMPEPSNHSSIKLEANEFTQLVNVDPHKFINNKKVLRKNCTVPEWVCKRADQQHINYSETLTEALIDKLNL